MNRRITRSRVKPASSNVPALSRKLPSIFRSAKTANTVSAVVDGKKVDGKGVGIFHLLFICLSLAIAAAGVLYHLHIRFEGVRLGYEASEQRKIQTKLMLQRRELRLELASMKEPGRIEDEAREKLGMETPRAEEFVHVNKTRKVVSVSGGAL
ncbi:MAG: cell division protein FtsL [Deltaproteobacteria bacterium]|nr:cell division protein FtsL [Deltaproteobacteria bacterium]